MRLLYLADGYSSSPVHHNLCRSLEELGNEVTVYQTYRTRDRQTDIRQTFEGVNYRKLTFEPGENNELRYQFDFYYKTRRKYTYLKENFDLLTLDAVHATTMFSEGAIAHRIWEEYAVPYTVAVRATDLHFYYRYMPHLWRLGSKILRDASAVVFITPALLGDFRRVPFMGRGTREAAVRKSIIIPNGIDQSWITNAKFEREPRTPGNILYIGRFDKNKNVERLANSVLALREEFPGLRLTMIGGGNERHEAVTALCGRYPDTLRYEGKIYDKDLLRHYMQAADLFAMVSHSETFGLVYIEAMSQGLPILYSKNRGIDGVFREKVGVGVNPSSQQSIQEGLRHLLTRHGEFEKIDKSINRFSWGSIARQYQEILTKSKQTTKQKPKI